MMNISPQNTAIAALFLTSIMVRIIPSFIPINSSQRLRRILDNDLPLAIFINFSIYIICTEIRTSPINAAIAISIAAILTLASRLGLILISGISSTAYIAAHFLLT